jgi:glycosyltransferase involved in cell wall biosynthesis
MNKGKKILFLVTQSEFGGAQRFIYTLTTNLVGYEIIVGAGPEGDDEKGLLFALEKKGINTRHLRYLRRSINPLFDFLGTIEIYRLIKKEKPDVLFLNCSKAGMLGGLAGRILKLPNIIYRIGGWTFNDPWPKWKKKMYIWIEKFSAGFKDIIINNAKSDTEQAIKLGIRPRNRIVTIYNGIDAGNLEFLSKEDARKFLQVEDSDFVVGTIANDYPAKGLKYLIEASKKLQNIKFVIIGKGNRFIPDAYKYLKAFDIFVLPSVKEGFPWTIIEAMAAEIPVITTRVGAIPEIIESAKNGLLIEPRHSEQIAEAIIKLFNDENLRKKIAENGRKTVIDKFSLDRMINQYIELFI